MGDVIVMEFVTLDGFVQDPDGGEGTVGGGWAFRHGPEPVAGDKFRLGGVMENGAMLLGRRTWEKFTGIWPARSDEFSTRMNAMTKLVASRSLDRTDAWANSTLVRGDLVDEVRARTASQDVVVTGSASVVRLLMEHDLVDEYRLLVFPTVVGTGTRLFPPDRSTNLELVSAEPVGPAVLSVYRRTQIVEEET